MWNWLKGYCLNITRPRGVLKLLHYCTNYYSYCFMCCTIVVYLSGLQVERFIANEDTSSISFRTFNFSPRDKYPVFSFCLNGLGIFRHKYIKDNFGISPVEYRMILDGDPLINRTMSSMNIDYEKATLNLESLPRPRF